MDRLEIAQRTLAEAREKAASAADAFDEATEENLEELETAFTEAEAEVTRANAEVEKQERIARAKKASPIVEPIVLGNEEKTYRADGQFSYFADILNAKNDRSASERLERNTREVFAEKRVGDSTTTYGGYFIPPLYEGGLWAELPRAGRPFADILPKMALPDVGNTITIPAVTTGAAVAVQADNGAVTSTTMQASQVTSNLVTIAGMNDYSRQAIERSFPGLDQIIFNDLIRAYNQKLDDQLLNGTGANNQLLGLRNVVGITELTYNDASPNQAKVVGQILNAVQTVFTTRFLQPTHIIMHPRRAAWLADPNGNTNFPLFQQGAMFHASGSQDNGFVGTLSGIPVVVDPNVTAVYGATTNADQIYVVYNPDFVLMEGETHQVAFEEVLSGNLEIRLQVYGYVFGILNRQPTSICVLSGTGLVSPAW